MMWVVRLIGTAEKPADNGNTFHIRAIDVGIFLGVVESCLNGTAPDLASAHGLNLDTDLPVFVPPWLNSTLPEDAPLRYVEGKPVE